MTQTDQGKDSRQIHEFMKFAANGNQAASDWLSLWHSYCHTVDDVIDDGLWDFESLLRLLVQACQCYSHPFYVQNSHQLQTPALLATGVYDLSVQWERPAEPLWHRVWADVFRHAGNDVTLSVALICGGYEHMMKVCGPLNASCYVYHKDRYSTPWETK